MRCPKCGYISFDHLEICLKCNKDVSKVSSQVEGTTYNVAAPSFLKFQPISETEVGGDTEISFDNDQEDFEVVDPDLEVLADSDTEVEEEGGISFDDDFGGLDELAEEDDFEITESEDGESIGMDLGQFEDAFEDEGPALGLGEEEIQLDMPDELSDISDLSSPVGEEALVGESLEDAEDELDDFNLNLDLEDLGDDFTLSTSGEKSLQDEDEVSLGELSLDDIGFSSTEEKAPAQQKKSPDAMDMDGDLDFDLDLGGLSLKDE